MPALGSLSAGQKAFATALVPAVGVSGIANYAYANRAHNTSRSDAELDRRMFAALGGQAVVGSALGLAGTRGVFQEMVPVDTPLANVDDLVRHPPRAIDAAVREAPRAGSAARVAGGIGVGLLLGASLGVFAKAVTTDKTPLS